MVLYFFFNNVILTNRRTGNDVHLTVRTKTDRFAELSRAITKARRAYPGYELFETF